MEVEDCAAGFCGVGQWEGVAEVYDGRGRFLANGADQRHVRSTEDDGRIRIDLSFAGPLKFSGHYYIKSLEDRRLYQGPVNCGYADAISENLVSAHGYWPCTGLSQKFFLMKTPDGNRQISLALMSRGSQLLYVVVGENALMVHGKAAASIPVVNGISYDLETDPKAGRSSLYLHRSGLWRGEFSRLDEGGKRASYGVLEEIENDGRRVKTLMSGSSFMNDRVEAQLSCNGYQAYSEAGDYVGSYSLYGGRALSGDFHYLPSGLRVTRREVCSGDGGYKAVVNTWYEGEKKIAFEWGFLKFEASGS